MAKKTVTIIIAMVVSLVCIFGVCACDSGNSIVERIEKDEQGLIYEEIDGAYSVTGIIGKPEADIVIPSTYNEKPVKAIGSHAFRFCKELGNVTIADGIISIGNGAFFRSSVTSIKIPDSVTFIGEAAFGDCWSLVSITLPNSITSIDGLCYGCTNLISVTIPDGVTSINYAFDGCIGLKSVTIPGSVTAMEKAFNRCKSLTSIIIPDSVTRINKSFKECDSLTIYCEAAVKPDGWEAEWNMSNRPVVWDCKNNGVAIG